MSWEKAAYTHAGAALLSESISGGALTITRAAASTGAAAALEDATALSGDTHGVTILGIDTIEDGDQTARRVRIQITGAAERYICHQVGVYGLLNDGPEETLLFIMQDERGVEVPAAASDSDFAIELAALIAISNKANISLHIDPQVQALQKLVDERISAHNDDPDAHLSVITAVAGKALKELENSGQIMSETQVKKLIQKHGSAGYFGEYDLTIRADGWKGAPESSGPYQYIYDAELADSASDLIPIGAAAPDSYLITSRAGVLNGCETFDGYVRFYAARIPEADFLARLVLLGGKGGGSGAAGEVSIGNGLERDEDGAIAVRIGEGLAFDAAKALTVRKDTVMTSDDLVDEEATQQEIAEMLK